MIFHPAIIALFIGSVLVSFLLIYSAYYSIHILKRWDIRSGSELQLILERKTYLISTIMNYAFGFQLASLFLFIFTADHLHTLFIGAMCAAGTLNVNEYGYPAVFMKVVNCLLAGIWLIMNYTDNRAFDYPLIKKKYSLLLVITPLLGAELFLQSAYFSGLRAHVITSCCGSLFSKGEESITSDIASLSGLSTKVAFYMSMVLTFVSGMYFYRKRSIAGYAFAFMSTVTFVVSIGSLISFISPYFYELPTHHCPFCILQREYGYAGYALYVTLLGGAISGLGVGAIMPFGGIQSLSQVIPAVQKKLTITALISYFLFTGIVTYQILFSNLTMKGY
jgi:hypothetical protein